MATQYLGVNDCIIKCFKSSWAGIPFAGILQDNEKKTLEKEEFDRPLVYLRTKRKRNLIANFSRKP